jgi:hypothetical protein
VALRCRSDAPEKHAPVSLTPLNSADDRPGANSQSGRCESIDRDAFAPLATPEFILQASKEEAESIETCEFEITLLRQHMR